MNSLIEQLTAAYRREEDLYRRVRELVRRQATALESGAGPPEVLAGCRQVEELMAEIENIEHTIRPAKEKWRRGGREPAGELDEILATIEGLIQEVAESQEAVQEGLLAYIRSQKEREDGARREMNAHRARRLYRAG
jgi:hypothetical protein